jgi:hypothetical protein
MPETAIFGIFLYGFRYYLWSDDTISTNSMGKYLSREDIEFMASYKKYGKVCCFKGFDNYSYSFNSRLTDSGYNNQFIYIKQYIDFGFDVYAYITLTSDNMESIKNKISIFIDRIQTDISELFPLRIVPLKIIEFTPTKNRMNEKQKLAINNQKEILNIWNEEIAKRFPSCLLRMNISELEIK